MRVFKLLRPLLAAAVVALPLAFATGAFGASDQRHHRHSGDFGRRHHGGALLHASIAPSVPADPAFHGVTPGGAPWVLTRGEVRLSRDGRFDLVVRGLVLPTGTFAGTPGPVTTISASLYCGADASTAAADTTQQVPISRQGNARIEDRSFMVPATCLAPVILVHPNGVATAYIALDGWSLS